MKKLTLLFTTLAFSTAIQASELWYTVMGGCPVPHYDDAESPSYESWLCDRPNGIFSKLSLDYNSQGRLEIQYHSGSKMCQDFEKHKTYLVNGTPVRHTLYCRPPFDGGGLGMIYMDYAVPTTKKGREFVANEMRKGGSIKYGDYYFRVDFFKRYYDKASMQAL